MVKVPPTLRGTTGASHNPALFYDEKDETGRVRTFFTVHPAGNRKVRRNRQRHHPYYTKPTHKGRDWWRLREDLIAIQKGKDENKGLLDNNTPKGS